MSTNHHETPTIDVNVAFPNGTVTNSRYDSHDVILHFINRVQNDRVYADRIRRIRITFLDDATDSTRAFGKTIAAVLPLLHNIDTLRLEGCLEYDFGILSSPLHFPRLTALTCDIPPSALFERFLAAHPTITELYLGGSADLNDYVGAGRTLAPEILPNLAVLECDIFLMGYYIPYHPVAEVIPQHANHPTEITREIAFSSLYRSTAGEGIEAGGGVTTLHLGHNYPLDLLARVAPNLVCLHLSNEEDEASPFPYGGPPPYHFWTAPRWAQCLGMFRRLKNISVYTNLPFTPDEQSNLIRRWSASCPTLNAITFKSESQASTVRRWLLNYQVRGWVVTQ